jgi:hypothetical protein
MFDDLPALSAPSNLIFATNWIVISALTLNMLLMQLLGGTTNGRFIFASIAWRWITWPFLVSFFLFFIFIDNCYVN